MNKKTILVIMPRFFGYENKIREALAKEGFFVYMIYENMDEISLWYRLFYVYLKSFKNKIMNKYYIKRISEVPNSIDYILVIRGDSLTTDIVGVMKSKFKNAKFVFYNWDSVENNKNTVEIIGEFDSVATFDMVDAEKYGWKYRPLFYVDESQRESKNRKYDFLFMCSMHSDRLKVLKYLKKYCEKKKLSLYDYLYSKPFHYFKQKYIVKNKDFRVKLDSVKVRFSQLSLADIYKLYSHSNIVVDYTHPNQNGFTMRTIESIGNRCKLLTNNKNVIDSDFYNRNNVYIYDLDNFEVTDDFLKCEYMELPKQTFEQYSLENWIKDLLEFDEKGEKIS